jgi:rod shape-determining protein MreD
MAGEIMSFRETIFILLSLAIGFILQYLPLADFMSWFVPQWVLMIFIFWQIQKPNLINFWWVWPIGLLLDVQQSDFLGTSVVSLACVLYVLQMMYQRLRVFNVAQQTLIIFLLICSFELVSYWALILIDDVNKPLSLWLPALISALVWPWLYLLLSSMSHRLR